MPYLLTFIVSVVASLGIFFTATPPTPPPAPQAPDNLGAALPSATAVFETSLAAPITSSASSMTLTANSVRGGGTLTGYQCFTVDEGSAQAETICGTISGTSVTSLTRGISQANGTTTVAALQFAHRRGANVKITDFPVIQIIKAQNNGEDTFPNPIRYAAGVVPLSVDDLTDKGYVDGVAFSGAGVVDATSIAKGVVELATGCEAASSTSAGTSGTLVVPASLATSSYNAATAGCKAVVTANGGLIDPRFIFNGQTLTFPANAGASSTVLAVNGSGALTWNAYSSGIAVSQKSGYVGTAASTTIFQATIPAGALGTSNVIHAHIDGVQMTNSTGENQNFQASYGGVASTTLYLGTVNNTPTGSIKGVLDLYIYADGATNAQKSALSFAYATTTGANLYNNLVAKTMFATSTSATDSTASQQLYISGYTSNATAPIGTFAGFVEVIRQ